MARVVTRLLRYCYSLAHVILARKPRWRRRGRGSGGTCAGLRLEPTPHSALELRQLLCHFPGAGRHSSTTPRSRSQSGDSMLHDAIHRAVSRSASYVARVSPSPQTLWRSPGSRRKLYNDDEPSIALIQCQSPTTMDSIVRCRATGSQASSKLDRVEAMARGDGGVSLPRHPSDSDVPGNVAPCNPESSTRVAPRSRNATGASTRTPCGTRAGYRITRGTCSTSMNIA